MLFSFNVYELITCWLSVFLRTWFITCILINNWKHGVKYPPIDLRYSCFSTHRRCIHTCLFHQCFRNFEWKKKTLYFFFYFFYSNELNDTCLFACFVVSITPLETHGLEYQNCSYDIYCSFVWRMIVMIDGISIDIYVRWNYFVVVVLLA